MNCRHCFDVFFLNLAIFQAGFYRYYKQRLNIGLFLIAITILSSCESSYSPKPRGYFRIELPKKSYQKYISNNPYTFRYPVYAKVVMDRSSDAKPFWNNVVFSQFNGKIHLTYHEINSQKEFNELVENSREFAFKNTVKATSIDEQRINYPDKKVYGIYYSIGGNTASSIQFFLTDSTKNYLRGALYFNEEPRVDSIQPVLDFVKKDIDVMIKSFAWKN